MQPQKKNFEISYKFPFVPKTATSLLYSVSHWGENYFLQVYIPLRAKMQFSSICAATAHLPAFICKKYANIHRRFGL